MATGSEWSTTDDPDATGPYTVRRRVLAIPVADYKDEDEDFAKAVDRQLELIGEWWCNPNLGERGFVAEHAKPVRCRRDVEEFLHHSGVREAGEQDVLFVFVAGHGSTAASGQHFLRLPESEEFRMMTTGYPTAEVAAAALGSRAKHVLVIVNTCDAGGIDSALAYMRRDLAGERRESGVLAVLATCDFDQPIPIGAFGVLLDQLYNRLRTISGISSEYLSLNDFMSEMHEVVRSIGGGLYPILRVLAFNEHLPHHALPNPGYRPPDDLVAPGLRQLCVPRPDLDYWFSQASGAGDTADGGWFFSGRRTLTRQLAEFLTKGSPNGYASTLIVTGNTSSGKSAIIARAVTFSDPGFRAHDRYKDTIDLAPPDTVPPVGSVHAAVLARNRTSLEILTLLLQALCEPMVALAPKEESVPELLEAVGEAITSAGVPVAIALDGLDEADDPAMLITQVIAPLAHLSRPPRLLIGLRSAKPLTNVKPLPDNASLREGGLLGLLYQATTNDDGIPQLVRTDGEGTAADVAEYLQAILANTPVAGPEFAHALLACLPTETSFLEARIAGFQLRNAPGPKQMFGDAQWLSGLHLGAMGLLRKDLIDAAGPDLTPEVALALLRAAAFAQGAGVPRASIWPAMAHAVAGQPVPNIDAAIDALLDGRLAGYLTADTEDDRIVYRPMHEALARILRDNPHLLETPPEQR